MVVLGLTIALLSTLTIAILREAIGGMLLIAYIVPLYGVFMFIGGLSELTNMSPWLTLLLLIACEGLMLYILIWYIMLGGGGSGVEICYKNHCSGD